MERVKGTEPSYSTWKIEISALFQCLPDFWHCFGTSTWKELWIGPLTAVSQSHVGIGSVADMGSWLPSCRIAHYRSETPLLEGGGKFGKVLDEVEPEQMRRMRLGIADHEMRTCGTLVGTAVAQLLLGTRVRRTCAALSYLLWRS